MCARATERTRNWNTRNFCAVSLVINGIDHESRERDIFPYEPHLTFTAVTRSNIIPATAIYVP